MRQLLVILLSVWPLKLAAVTTKSTTECLGPTKPKAYVVYLHGLAPPQQKANEEGDNRSILERLARDLSLRIAMPRGSLCPNGKLCWPSRDQEELLQTFQEVQRDVTVCWSGQPRYSLVGFSNGGYFAFKLYKAHQDPALFRIVAAGSAGSWDEKLEKPNPLSRFAMMMGRRDMSLKAASALAAKLRHALPGFQFETFDGAHELSYEALRKLLDESSRPGNR